VSLEAVRRYLQPSQTLRWHPWAPLAAALLLLGFAFFLGARWGYIAGARSQDYQNYLGASAESMRYQMQQAYPARALLYEASVFDAAVHQAVTRPAPSRLVAWNARLERLVFLDRPAMPVPPEPVVAHWAEVRLKELSAANPRWQATAAYCDEIMPPATGLDVTERYVRTATEYSHLLGRDITAQQLAPAVPGGKCAPRKENQ
jgi:hypothetical protein